MAIKKTSPPPQLAKYVFTVCFIPRFVLFPFASSNVLQHYLKLPAYGSVEKTRSKLLKAIEESSHFSFT
jgi:hypothetical protein